ncbi:hypothetical protein A33O_20510 [Nitratireductor aquibiodomus RA22]|uniref:Transmembrane anchor protein n=1 Tax=Nitratireductor aquibiodomus RA22 TaxID=1189611 RepID=I5BRK0_9HYPH|nr:hypothetical protein [Nitratireductor aquibiodomus]EIM72202.1 hypothetical protein A33O_20510 [Nitratireductor aquibiodomus RA22]
MYNTDLPRRADLPTSAQLRRSTLIAALTAAAILIFVVLPSEYGMDPTRVGRLLGLTEMGEIKTQLAREAALDAARAGTSGDAEIIARLDRIETLIEGLASDAGANPQKDDPLAGLIQQQRQTTPAPAAQTQQQATTPASEWRDELSFVLTPGQGVEVKLVMNEGERARFFWTANGANVNYDTHGDGGGKSVSYEQGRGVPEQAGVLEAAFTGNHGWFWRNRTNRDVTITLRTAGQYLKINRMM